MDTFSLHDVCVKRYYVRFHDAKLIKIAGYQIEGELNFQFWDGAKMGETAFGQSLCYIT